MRLAVVVLLGACSFDHGLVPSTTSDGSVIDGVTDGLGDFEYATQGVTASMRRGSS